MAFRIIIYVFVLFLTAATAALAEEDFIAKPSPDDRLKATSWRVFEVDGKVPECKIGIGEQPSLRFSPDNAISLRYGNSGGGEYSADATKLTTSQIGQTMAFYPLLNEVESPFFRIARQAERYEISGNILTIYAKDGSKLKAARLPDLTGKEMLSNIP